MWHAIKNRWHSEGGYSEVLKLAFPLILSTGSITIQHVVDRMFLTWYSPEAIAASLPAALINFTCMAPFMGTAAYVNTFVAQYHGAKRRTRIGPSLWQGLHFSLLAGMAVLLLYPLAPTIFRLAGHSPDVQIMEIHYFQILIFAGFPITASSAMAGFFSGRGKAKVVMWVTFASTAANIVLDYGLIFGYLGMPALGIRGAALATAASQYVRLSIYTILIMKPSLRRKYHTLKGWKPDKELFTRLLRYGFPNGVHFFLEGLAYTLLILFVGRLGTEPLAASNITFNINHMAFLPMMGFGMAVTILVGRRLGEDRPDLAERTTWSTFHMTFLFMAVIATAYALIPRVFLAPYAAQADPQQFAPIARVSANLLKFVAVYAMFDMMNMIFAAAIKGAGDTRFVMGTAIVLSWLLMVVPSYLSTAVFHRGIYTVWTFATLYITVLGVVFLVRFLGGKWKTMRVIEEKVQPPAVLPPESELPITE